MMKAKIQRAVVVALVGIFITACGGLPVVLPEEAGTTAQDEMTPTIPPKEGEIRKTEPPRATPTPNLPFSSVEVIQVGEVADLERQFLEAYQNREFSLVSVEEPLLNVGFSGWSPDGKYMLLATWHGEIQEFPYQDGSGGQGVYRLSIRHLWVAHADGTNAWEIAPNAVLPQWSPDGKWVAFLTDALIDGFYNHELWIVSTDGQSRHMLVEGVREYTWLDDENLIFTQGIFHGDRFWKIGITDQQIQPLDITGSENNQLNAPAISPSTQRIAFSNINAKGVSELWIGSVEDKQITIEAKVPRNDIAHVSWSPNGDLLAYGIFFKPYQILKANGTELAEIEQIAGNEPASWSADSRMFTFAAKGQLFAVNADGSHLKQLIDLPNIRPSRSFWSPDGKSIGFNSQGDMGAMILNIE